MSLNSPTPGSQFGRYRIDERIGMGGMGVVFRATDTRLNRTVALKVMAGRLTGSDEFTQRFQREADIMARLDSPHVITIHDHGVEDGVPWISTQFVRGGDLGDLLRNRGPLPLARAAQVCAQIAEALADAHDAGVVHRDVKPSNVLLRDGSADADPFVYLCDFGIAHTGTTGLTQTGGVAGSWAWLAPERTKGDPGTARSDIYALGCVLWATLTGHAPYVGSDVEVALAQVQQPVPQFVGDDPVTRRVNAVLARALAKDPADRYASAGEFRTDLLGLASYGDRALVAPEAPDDTATGTGTQVRAVHQVTRPRRWAPVAALAAVALLAGAAYVGWRVVGDHEAKSPEPVVVQGDVDGDGKGDLLVRWFNYGTDYKEGRDFLIRSTGDGFDAPERLPQPDGLSVRGDVDGDGLDDVVGIDDNNETKGLDVTVIGADGDEHRQALPGRGNRAEAHPILADVDGDGLDDLVLTVPRDTSASRSPIDLEVALSTDDGFADPVTWGSVGNWASYGEVILPGDVDGDGRDDLVLRPTTNAGGAGASAQLRVMLSDGSGFSSPTAGRETPDDGPVPPPLDVADLDGDGAEEVVVHVRGKPGTLRVHRFEKDALSEGEDWVTDPDVSRDDTQDITLVDVNGDGMTDAVLQRVKTETTIRLDVALSTGDSFEPPVRWGKVPCLNQGCAEVWSMLAGHIV